jgi:triacylglycerol lipase
MRSQEECSMSVFVRKDRSAFPPHALDGFPASKQFDLVSARAMMWLSQLAYETDDEPKVDSILSDWQLTKLGFKSNDPGTGLPPHSACVVVAEGQRATFVTFAGSDPLKFQDWITNFETMPSPKDLHSGFEKAVETVLPDIQVALGKRVTPSQRVFFTGHSLGGALAILAAWRTSLLPNAPEIVVYTFGSPRNGGPEFFNDYTPRLGDFTFRLIHGTDIVPTVPPTLLDVYHHVGQAVQCRSGGLFDGVAPMARDGNKPDLVDSAIQSGFADIGGAVAALQLIPGFRRGLRPLLAGFLPRMIGDHVPDSYFRALSIVIKG